MSRWVNLATIVFLCGCGSAPTPTVTIKATGTKATIGGPIKAGYRLVDGSPQYLLTETEVVVTVNPPTAVSNISVSGPNFERYGETRNQTLGTLTFKRFGTAPTPSPLTNDSGWLLEVKHSGKTLATAKVLVIVPSTVDTSQPARDEVNVEKVVQGKNIAANVNSVPPFAVVPADRFIKVTEYGFEVTHRVLDHCCQPLDAIYDHQPVTEYGVDIHHPIMAGAYADPVSLSSALSNALEATYPWTEAAVAEWEAAAPNPPNPRLETVVRDVEVAGHGVGTLSRTLILTAGPPTKLQVVWIPLP